MITWYILEGRKVVPTQDMDRAAAFYEKPDSRRVASFRIDGIHISTVFLSLNHNWTDEGPPIVFETMVFDERGEKGADLGTDWTRRYSTYAQALEGHNQVVDEVRAMLKSAAEIAEKHSHEKQQTDG
jgi:hypothetical protein